MIDIKYLSENTVEVIKRLTTRGQNFDYLQDLVILNNTKKTISMQLDHERMLKNKTAATYFALNNEKLKLMENLALIKNDQNALEIVQEKLNSNQNEITALQAAQVKNRELIHHFESELKSFDEKINELWLKTPNLPDLSVPVGNSAADNIVVKSWKQNALATNEKPHWDIARDLDIIDFERATKITGTRFVIYKKQGAQLIRALVNFMLDMHIAKGYEEISPPNLVNPKALITTGNLPKFGSDLFKIEASNYYLIPTAEVSLTNLHVAEIIPSGKLPLNYCAYTTCYRSEAGAASKDNRGIIRLHQFHKVELVKFTTPETSQHELEVMKNDACQILEALALPYQVLELCTGDLGFSANKTYDIEVWMPAQKKYREISSCSNCGDFQSRRGKIRYKNVDTNETNLVHTLNGSALAIDRLIAAILENNYQPTTNSVLVPKVLQKYLQGMTEIK